MVEIISIIMGALILVHGLFLMTRKKYMVSRGYGYIFDKFVFILLVLINRIEFTSINQVKMNQKLFDLLFVLILLSIVWLIAVIKNRGVYTIYNVNAHMIKSTLTDILKEKNISYGEKGNKIILKAYDETIPYKHSFSSVNIYFNDIRHLFFYKELITELKIRIKEIDSKVFPKLGIVHVMLGMIILYL